MKKIFFASLILMLSCLQAQTAVTENEKLLLDFTTSGSDISVAEAKEALAYHNLVRSEVGVEPLVWSTDLSIYAQEWANYLAENNCAFSHRSELGKDVKNYGENLAMSSGAHTATDGAKLWYSEISKFQNVVLNGSNWYDAGHYSQMVWRNTKQVGMGVSKCSNGYYIIVANYNPPGNYMGEKAY